LVADDVVTTNSLATHLGMTRQNVAQLTAQAVRVQRSDHCYDQTAGYATSSTCAMDIGARRVSKPTPITSGPRPS
jgi:formate-dependent phosphoribosylglycinamide formyltransferase (GAR transformylase)